jgi:hypothetical protein
VASTNNKKNGVLTICKNCHFFKNLEPDSPRKDVWYNHLCKASPLKKEIDPYDGEEKYVQINSLGAKYYTDKGFEYCRNINSNRNCSKFKDRQMLLIDKTQTGEIIDLFPANN